MLHRRDIWGVIACGVVAGCGANGGTPDEESSGGGEHHAHQAAELVLGFESTEAWFASDGSSAEVSSAAHQGRSSLSFATNGRGTLSSAPFSFERTPNVLDFAVRSPRTSWSAPTSAAEVEALLTCEEREVRGASLGRAALAGFQGEGFERVAFSVPAALKDQLAGGCGALVVRLVVTSAERSATYLFDDLKLRSGTPQIVELGEPLCGLPSSEGLLRSASETVDGYWDFQAWSGGSAAQLEIAALNEVLAPYHTSTLGLAFDDVNQRAIVVVDPEQIERVAPELWEQIASADVDLPIFIQPACNPIRELERAASVIQARQWHPDAPATTFASHLDPGSGVHVLTFDPLLGRTLGGVRSSSDPRSSEIGGGVLAAAGSVEDSLPSAEAAIDALVAQLGALVRVEFGKPSRLGRLDDGEPHFGGAGIDNVPNSTRCTAGFVVRRNGLLGSVSVRHCFVNGDLIFSGPKDYGAAAGAAPYPASDMIRIEPGGQQFIDTIHTDPCCPNARDQSGKANVGQGAMVCFSGKVTRAKCGIRVTALNQTFCDVDGCTPGLTVGERAGVTIAVKGDSGAPVYTQAGAAGATINGMVVAGATVSRTFFHTVSQIESKLGVTVAF